MYKRSSENLQRAARAEGRGNEAGVDSAAFAGESEPARLKERKRALEARFSALNDSMADARRKGNWTGVARWRTERADLSEQMQEVERSLGRLKVRGEEWTPEKKLEERKRFERVFFNMAKELLAEPVFQRVFTATLHRLGSDDA